VERDFSHVRNVDVGPGAYLGPSFFSGIKRRVMKLTTQR